MKIDTVMAQLIVTDLEASTAFYSKLFGRGPDARPMDGLAEWHMADAGAVQVYQEPARAGRSGVTLNVTDLDEQVAALDKAGVAHDAPMDAKYVRVVQLSDPDENRIVFTQ